MPHKITPLNSVDPRERFAAVKEIARNKDVTMLDKLAEMAEDDPSDQVRDVAAKAIAYIKGEARAGTHSARAAAVSERDQERAKQLVDSALSYQIEGERDRALKELSKALEIDPNLENDAFFKSVLSEVTQGDDDAAMAVLEDRSKIEEITKSERKRKQEARAAEHEGEVERSNWSSAGMDLAIYTLILIFATMFLPIVASQAAQRYLVEQNAAWTKYQEAVAANDQSAQAPVLDQSFIDMAQSLSLASPIVGVGMGIGAGIYGLISILITLATTHLAARYLFGGVATFPHLIYKVVSFYNSRLPVFFGLLYITIILTFLLGGSFITVVGFGAVGLYSLFLSLKIISRVGEAYDFGAAKGCMSLIAGSIIVGVISFIAQMLFMGAILASMGLSMPA